MPKPSVPLQSAGGGSSRMLVPAGGCSDAQSPFLSIAVASSKLRLSPQSAKGSPMAISSSSFSSLSLNTLFGSVSDRKHLSRLTGTEGN